MVQLDAQGWMSTLRGHLELGHSPSGPCQTEDPQTWGFGEAERAGCRENQGAFESLPDSPGPAGIPICRCPCPWAP